MMIDGSNIVAILFGVFCLGFYFLNVSVGETDTVAGIPLRYSENPLLYSMVNGVILTLGVLCFLPMLEGILNLEWIHKLERGSNESSQVFLYVWISCSLLTAMFTRVFCRWT